MLRLLSLLQTHRSWGGGELADRLTVSARTLRRDIDRLREFGYRIEAERGTEGGYRLEAGAELPPLVLDDDEAIAMAVGLRANTTGPIDGIEESSIRALTKVEQVLPKRLRSQVSALSAHSETATMWSGPTVNVETLMTIAHACRDWHRVTFCYVSGGGDETRRRVEPHKMVSVGRRWYLVAWDNDRNDWRTFRADRMTEVEQTETKFSERQLPASGASEFVKQNIDRSWQIGAEVSIIFRAPAADVRATWPMHHSKIEELTKDSCRLTTNSDAMSWIAMAIGVTEQEFQVEKPQELIDLCHRLGERFIQ